MFEGCIDDAVVGVLGVLVPAVFGVAVGFGVFLSVIPVAIVVFGPLGAAIRRRNAAGTILAVIWCVFVWWVWLSRLGNVNMLEPSRTCKTGVLLPIWLSVLYRLPDILMLVGAFAGVLFWGAYLFIIPALKRT